MASPFQQRALQRKLIYLGLILVLFTVSGVYRAFVVEAKAQELALRDQDIGEVELGSSALQLSLTGSRGFVVTGLWYSAIEAQKKNRWNELELYVRALTKLQPHFIIPWRFQSWNLAYNVSVEADQVKDKYFYVAEGTKLLAEGERQNRYNPTLCFDLGFYQQHKIMQSDETNYMRCLYQMSCMPPPERNPQRFWTTDANGKPKVNEVEFEKFCVAHPQFVRRLHDKLRCARPEDVVAFLEENKRVPTSYEEEDPRKAGQKKDLKHVADYWPVLPPPAGSADRPVALDQNELTYLSELKDDFDAFAAARAWYGYAQEALPPPDPKWPGRSAPITDRTRQRLPKMATVIFRNYPCRAQSYVAERLAQEGWFDDDGWLITGWFAKDKFPGGGEARVGDGRKWARDAWGKAHEMWRDRGEKSHLLLETQDEANKRALALKWLAPRGLDVGAPGGPEPPADDPDHPAWEAAEFLHQYQAARGLTNVAHFYHRAFVEMQDEMIQARRTYFLAAQNVRQGYREKAALLMKSPTGLERLRLVLDKPAYGPFRNDAFAQEELYEIEVRYIKLMQDLNGGSYKRLANICRQVGNAAMPQGPAPIWIGLLDLVPWDNTSVMSNLPVPEYLPPERMRLEAPGNDGKPLVSENVVRSVKLRHGLLKPEPMTPEMMMKMRQSMGPPPPGMENMMRNMPPDAMRPGMMPPG